MSFFELFQPGYRFLREEKDRQQLLVAQPLRGAGGGPLGIDLDSGKASFTMPSKPDEALEHSPEELRLADIQPSRLPDAEHQQDDQPAESTPAG